MDVLTDKLKMLVNTWIPFGPRFLSMIGDMLSGPRALELLDLLMASAVCFGVITIQGSLDGFLRFLTVVQFSLDHLRFCH